MQILVFLLFSLLLSLVSFSVAVSSSVYRCIQTKEALKIALVFGLFQAGMIALGWLIGFAVKGLFYSMAVPVAALIVFMIGARMFLDSRRFGREHRTIAVENIRILLGFSFVTSINTLLLGMGLGIIYTKAWLLAAVLFGMTFLMTIIGILVGKRGMMNLGKTAESTAGLAMLVISVVIVLQYLKIL
jgi:putative Mn2+ efflux pump MntP